jgi:conjugal transfer mating pair stabilization protein TraG
VWSALHHSLCTSIALLPFDAGVTAILTAILSFTSSMWLNVVNFDVRQAIANSERAAANSNDPAAVFADRLATEITGQQGLRNRYLGEADSARGTADLTSPLTSWEQSSVLSTGRFSNDLANGPFDGNPSFKKRD